jgi:hypothetical protein
MAPRGLAAHEVSPVRSVARKCKAIAWAHGFQKVVMWPALSTSTKGAAGKQRYQRSFGVDVEVVRPPPGNRAGTFAGNG